MEFLPVLARIARLSHFPQARNLQETIWKQLGGIMHALGKRVSSRRNQTIAVTCKLPCSPVIILNLRCGGDDAAESSSETFSCHPGGDAMTTFGTASSI